MNIEIQEYKKFIFSIRNLRLIKQWYLFWQQVVSQIYISFPIQETLSLKLRWSHYCKIMKIENNLSVRVLRERNLLACGVENE